MSARGKYMTLAGLTVFFGGMFALPFVLAQKNQKKNLQWRQEPLSRTEVQRGPFMNSGSKDAGIDPNWDPVRGYTGRR